MGFPWPGEIANELAGIRTELGAIHIELAALNKKVDHMSEQQTELDTDVANLAAVVTDVATQTATLGTDLGAVATEIAALPTDVIITKRQWGAFHGTGLEQQLRRKGIKTIVMGGIATNFGVESTARAGFDQGYEMVFAEDAMTSLSAEMHDFSVKKLFPIMGRVRSSDEIVKALG